MPEQTKTPFPDLRIIPATQVHAHELHDSQRSNPLFDILRQADYLTNPPIVAPMHSNDDEDPAYVILDGANRFNCFVSLDYNHLLVQVASYDDDFVELGVWNHIVSDWERVYFIEQLSHIGNLDMQQGWQINALAHILLRSGPVLSIHASIDSLEEKNHVLRQLVNTYQHNATLYRTALTDPMKIWELYPEAMGLVMFPQYQPENIIEAARQRAYLPPGVSRHIIHGRALRLNYPLKALQDPTLTLDEKNAALQTWLKEKLAKRAVRYYAESTYQFDE